MVIYTSIWFYAHLTVLFSLWDVQICVPIFLIFFYSCHFPNYTLSVCFTGGFAKAYALHTCTHTTLVILLCDSSLSIFFNHFFFSIFVYFCRFRVRSLSCSVFNYDLSDVTILNRQNQTSLTGKVLVYIVGSGSNHCNFTEQGERNAVEPSDEAVDLLVAAWFLLPKLVAREGQHIEVVRSKVSLELLQVFIVLLGEATFTRYIHNQGHLKHTMNAMFYSPND